MKEKEYSAPLSQMRFNSTNGLQIDSDSELGFHEQGTLISDHIRLLNG
jgi:hypothetical protein|tara:strand:+ start:409 stop:552 length:144 start_codon:yes stop_codon:yes gene_type:complete